MMNGVKCACCDSTNVDILFEQSFFKVPVMRCNNCDHNFTTITSKEKINELYSKSFWNLKFKEDMMDEYNIDTKPKIFKKLWDILIPLIGANKSQAHSHHTYLKSHVIGKSLLEIGSGEGYVLEYFEGKKFNVYGIEPSEDNCKKITKKLKNGKCDKGFIEDLTLHNEKFDVIIMSHVFEHLIDCKGALLKLKGFLKKDGILFIEVPNCNIEKNLMGSVKNVPHIHHFTKKSIRVLAEKNNYNVIDYNTYSPYISLQTYYGYLKYIINWIMKKDCYYTDSNGDYIRVILKNK